jgi:hypothetical protein
VVRPQLVALPEYSHSCCLAAAACRANWVVRGDAHGWLTNTASPRSLRALYGHDGTQNACHGSDSPASAAREIKFFFPHLAADAAAYAEPAAAADYITTKLQARQTPAHPHSAGL